MTFASMMNGGAGRGHDEVSKLVNAANGINRHYSPYQFGSRNPYESSYDEPNPQHYPYQPGYESESLPHEHTSGQYAAPTFHQQIYSTIGAGDVQRHSHSSNTNTQMSMSALTLLAFLFFINMLQSCLKEQMHTMNPTVMVMTAGSARLKETGTSSLYFDENKELNQNIQTEDEVILSAPADANKMEFLTNDQGDIFYQPQKGISNKLTNSFIEEKELSDKINN